MKLFLDANVLFSAANRASNLNRFIRQLAGSHDLMTSDYAREEAARNIRLKRPEWEGEFGDLMKRLQVVAGLDGVVDAVIDPKDRPILATALRERCAFLVTGDKRHFAHLFGQPLHGLTVVTPLMLAKFFATHSPPSA